MATRTISKSLSDDTYDNYLLDTNASTNYSTTANIYSGWTDLKITRTWHSLISFPMSWATVSSFDSVILRLNVESGNGTDPFSIFTINNIWGRTNDTWNNRDISIITLEWNNAGGDYDANSLPSYTFPSTGWNEIDVTTQVNNIRSGMWGINTDWATLLIRKTVEGVASQILSFTSSHGANSPQLVFTWTVPLSLTAPSKSNIRVVQSSSSILSGSKVQHTSFKSQNVSSTLSGKHKETQYQIFENHIPASGSPLINLKSSSNIRKNGNILKLTKNELKMYLKGNTYYKIRMRFRDSSGWTNWTPLNSFKTRDKDYKRG